MATFTAHCYIVANLIVNQTNTINKNKQSYYTQQSYSNAPTIVFSGLTPPTPAPPPMPFLLHKSGGGGSAGHISWPNILSQ